MRVAELSALLPKYRHLFEPKSSTREPCPLHEIFNIQRSGPLGYWLATSPCCQRSLRLRRCTSPRDASGSLNPSELLQRWRKLDFFFPVKGIGALSRFMR